MSEELPLNRFDCSHCGPSAIVDEEGLCKSCGRWCMPFIDGKPQFETAIHLAQIVMESLQGDEDEDEALDAIRRALKAAEQRGYERGLKERNP